MKPHPLLIASLVTLAAPAQDAWTSYVANLGTRSRLSGRWILAVTPEFGNTAQEFSWRREDLYLRLTSTNEFTIDLFPPSVFPARGWKEGEVHWALISPEGVLLKEGSGRPSATTTMEALSGAGFKPKWERREAFLKEHPEHGEARAEALEEALELAGRRIQALQASGLLTPPPANVSFFERSPASFATPSDPTGAVLAEQVFGNLAEELELMLDLPASSSGRPFLSIAIRGREWEMGQSPRLRALLNRLFDRVMEELEARPRQDGLWLFLSFLGPALGRDPLEAAARLTHQPGDAWPSPMFLRLTMEGFSRRKNWSGGLAFLEALSLPNPEPGPTPERWKTFRNRRAEVQIHRFRALLQLERWSDAEGALAAARRLAGNSWGSLSNQVRRALSGLQPEAKARFQKLAAEPELKDPEPPAPVPLTRLVLLGEPTWSPQWERLKPSEPLQAWDTGELRWELGSADLVRDLEARYGWPPGGRWVLLQGDDLRASGDACPSPQDLAGRLEAVAPGRLHRLTAAIQASPRNLDLRQQRAEHLLSRKPQGALEAHAAEDARLSRMPLRFPEGWTPSPDIWPWHAQKLLPELEQELRAWPSRSGLWRTWVQWAALHPQRPSPLVLVRGLALWGSERRFGASLPKEVHQAVAEELRQGGRFEEMRAWFQDAWDGLGPGGFYRGRSQVAFLGPRAERLKDLETAIVSPLREALGVLRRNRELLALDAAFAAMKGDGKPDQRGGR